MYYSAVLILKAIVANQTKPEKYEESILLVEAEDESSAIKRAEQLAISTPSSYRNADGNTVTWVVEKVVGVCEILDKNLRDGVELHSRYFDDLDAYRKFERRSNA